jgi:phosphate starvation-inducible protein PhoH and related proteins
MATAAPQVVTTFVSPINSKYAAEWTLPTSTNERLLNFCGPVDQHLRQIEIAFSIRIKRRGDHFELSGARANVEHTVIFLGLLESKARSTISPEHLQLMLVETSQGFGPTALISEAEVKAETAPTKNKNSEPVKDDSPTLQTRRADLAGRTANQRNYLRNIQTHDVTFGIGPAGTGKTYLAVACAVDALERDLVKRIVLTRPAVEAGERLGFLPGDLNQKVDPYLRPLYDALYDLLGFERTNKLFERQIIEIAPLAYMRGRTLNHAFVILDEAQNTTAEQMKMFLTRLGFGSKAVITGDVTQVDLPKNVKSGLVDARQVLGRVRGISFSKFASIDVVRHPLVGRIVDAYEAGNLQGDDEV